MPAQPSREHDVRTSSLDPSFPFREDQMGGGVSGRPSSERARPLSQQELTSCYPTARQYPRQPPFPAPPSTPRVPHLWRPVLDTFGTEFWKDALPLIKKKKSTSGWNIKIIT